MITNDKNHKLLELEIEKYFDSKINKALNNRSSELILSLKELILRGGKRSRPALFFLTLDAYGATNTDDHIKLAMSLELYHQFLLIHDDIIDKDYIRYGGPNISGYYEKEFKLLDESVPDSMALLAGDLLFSYVYEIISKDSSINSDMKLDMLSLFSEINESVVFGQQLDTLNVKSLGSEIDQTGLINIHSLKTAPYSVELPMQMVGIILNLDASEIKTIHEFANNFGIYYQLMDDYSDYFVNKSLFNNRQKYRDYKQGRITCPYIYGMQSASYSDKKILENSFGNKDLTNQEMKNILLILKRNTSDIQSKELIDKYLALTKNSLNKMKINKHYKDIFLSMISQFET